MRGTVSESRVISSLGTGSGAVDEFGQARALVTAVDVESVRKKLIPSVNSLRIPITDSEPVKDTKNRYSDKPSKAAFLVDGAAYLPVHRRRGRRFRYGR